RAVLAPATMAWTLRSRRRPSQQGLTHMKFPCSLFQQSNGAWLARHSGSSLGQVEVTARTREEVLQRMRNELRYRSEYCPCSGVDEDFVELQVLEERGRP